MQPFDPLSESPGKVLPLNRGNEKPEYPEVIASRKILTILKEMLESWREPKPRRAR